MTSGKKIPCLCWPAKLSQTVKLFCFLNTALIQLQQTAECNLQFLIRFVTELLFQTDPKRNRRKFDTHTSADAVVVAAAAVVVDVDVEDEGTAVVVVAAAAAAAVVVDVGDEGTSVVVVVVAAAAAAAAVDVDESLSLHTLVGTQNFGAGTRQKDEPFKKMSSL